MTYEDPRELDDQDRCDVCGWEVLPRQGAQSCTCRRILECDEGGEYDQHGVHWWPADLHPNRKWFPSNPQVFENEEGEQKTFQRMGDDWEEVQ